MDNVIKRPPLYRYFLDSANVLLAEHDRSKGQGASANLGHNRELFCDKFLRHILPPKLTLRNGEIWDSQGNRTGQLDIVILRDDTPSLTFGGIVSGADTYLVEGVFGVIEVKSNLTRDKLQEALTTLKRVKLLRPSNDEIAIVGSPALSRPLLCIFAYEGASWETLSLELTKPENSGVVDLICVLKRGALIARGLLLQFEQDASFASFNGKAASLAWLYFHLISYSTSFLGRSLNIAPYFEPINGWIDEDN
jgi:hypothetical protein